MGDGGYNYDAGTGPRVSPPGRKGPTFAGIAGDRSPTDPVLIEIPIEAVVSATCGVAVERKGSQVGA
jgi:hypothetical protein